MKFKNALAGLVVSAATWLAVAPSADALRIDRSFGTDGFANIGRGIETNDLLVDSANRIIVSVGAYEAKFGGYVARLKKNGALDRSFGVGGYALRGQPPLIDLDSAGRIVGIYGSTLVRLDTSGRLDPSFGIGGTVTLPDSVPSPDDLKVLPNDQIVVAGDAGSQADSCYCGTEFAVARLHPDGSLDNSFGDSGVATVLSQEDAGSPQPGVTVHDLLITPHADILVVGDIVSGIFGSASSVSFDPVMFALDHTGSLDSGFSGDGAAMPKFSTRAKIAGGDLIGGRLVLFGAGFGPSGSERTGWFVAGFQLPGGELDGTFSGDGESYQQLGRLYCYEKSCDPTADARAVVPTPSGGFLIGGWAPGSRTAVARYRPDGELVQAGGKGLLATTARPNRGIWELAVQGQLGTVGIGFDNSRRIPSLLLLRYVDRNLDG